MEGDADHHAEFLSGILAKGCSFSSRVIGGGSPFDPLKKRASGGVVVLICVEDGSSLVVDPSGDTGDQTGAVWPVQECNQARAARIYHIIKRS